MRGLFENAKRVLAGVLQVFVVDIYINMIFENSEVWLICMNFARVRIVGKVSSLSCYGYANTRITRVRQYFLES